MEYQQKILLLVTALLTVFALYVALTSASSTDTRDAQALVLKGIGFGSGAVNYMYSYTELSDDYGITYRLTNNGSAGMIEVQNPLSLKKVYFTQNDTVLCVRYPVNATEETCASVKDREDTLNYVESLRATFLNDTRIQNNIYDMEYLVSKEYVTFKPGLISDSVSGKNCTRVDYGLDMRNISLDEAARFGIGSSAPRFFSWTMCVDNETGYPYEKSFNYSYEGRNHTYTYRFLGFSEGKAGLIIPPGNLSENSDSVMVLLSKERGYQVRLAKCFTDNDGEKRESCVADMALNLKRSDLCGLSGTRKDRCLVSIVPLTKDDSLCRAIEDQSYLDDCYIELAGAYKNSTYCSNLKNQSKMGFCLDVSQSSAGPDAED